MKDEVGRGNQRWFRNLTVDLREFWRAEDRLKNELQGDTTKR